VLSSHVFLLHAAHRRRCPHFVPDLSLFRSANVTRPPRILQASRTGWLHTPVIFAASSPSTPFPSPQLPPRPAAEAATSLRRPRPDSTRGWRFFPPSASLDPRPIRLPSPHPNNQNHTSAAHLPHSSSTADRRPQTTDHALSPSNHSTATRFLTQNIPPVLSSLLSTNQVLAPHSNLDSPPSTQPRETATLLPPWSTGRSCIAPGNVALWCEEFRLPIGMPGPVLQNLVISKPKVSLRILNDNHDHQPVLT
jgi:hypothetical protein